MRLRKVGMMNDNVNNNAQPLNAPNVAHNFMKVVDERLDYFRTGEPVRFTEYVSAFQGF